MLDTQDSRLVVYIVPSLSCFFHLLQCQSFRKNQHDEHTDKEFVLIIRSTNIATRFFLSIGNGCVSFLFDLRGPKRNLRGPVSNRSDSVISNNPNAQASCQTRNPTTQACTQVRHAGIGRIGIFAIIGWFGDGLANNDSDNESVNTDHYENKRSKSNKLATNLTKLPFCKAPLIPQKIQHTSGHDNWNHILHNGTWVSDSCVDNANTRLPCSQLYMSIRLKERGENW
jgi:hypothetical protein